MRLTAQASPTRATSRARASSGKAPSVSPLAWGTSQKAFKLTGKRSLPT
ncbi:MAG: hypothetical protein IH975_02735 [Nitrospinae bacterium]|nr:hypothetical protein [Nitrospinota bacterium]